MKSLYITASQKNAGTLFVSLGLMEILKRNLHRVAFFRPIIASRHKRDNDIEFIRERYGLAMEYEQCFGCDVAYVEEMFAKGKRDTLVNELLEKFKQLEAEYDFVLCEGIQRSVLGMNTGYDLNLTLAQNFSSAIVSVVSAKDLTTQDIYEEILIENKNIIDKGSQPFATFVSRIEAKKRKIVEQKLKDYTYDVYYLEELEELSLPILEDVIETLGAKKLLFSENDHTRVVRAFRVAALGVDNFLAQIQEDDLVVVPADRSEIILALFGSLYSSAYPNISGILFPFAMDAHPNIKKLIEGLKGHKIPILSVATDTYETAQNLSKVYARLRVKSERKIALALGLFSASVDAKVIEEKISHIQSDVMTPLMFTYKIFELARQNKKKIVLPESQDERILRAAEILLRRNVVDLVLLGAIEQIKENSLQLGLDLSQAELIDPLTSSWHEAFAEELYALRKEKGLSLEAAKEMMGEGSYFATMMVHKGYADGMVSGAIHSTADTIRPALQIIKTTSDVSVVSSVFFMCLKTKVLVYGDCAVNLDPDAAMLADIAIASATTARAFGIEPKVAMLSYSTGESGSGADVEKVREATALVKAKRPQLLVEGPIQYDAAIDKEVAHTKLPDSQVAGEASVFIFPDLNTGNNTYKAVQRSSGALAIGPILQGLNKPVNDLSRGCSIDDIVNTVAITAIQAGDKE
jgi:phosphate acetyltransferase